MGFSKQEKWFFFQEKLSKITFITARWLPCRTCVFFVLNSTVSGPCHSGLRFRRSDEETDWWRKFPFIGQDIRIEWSPKLFHCSGIFYFVIFLLMSLDDGFWGEITGVLSFLDGTPEALRQSDQHQSTLQDGQTALWNHRPLPVDRQIMPHHLRDGRGRFERPHQRDGIPVPRGRSHSARNSTSARF